MNDMNMSGKEKAETVAELLRASLSLRKKGILPTKEIRIDIVMQDCLLVIEHQQRLIKRIETAVTDTFTVRTELSREERLLVTLAELEEILLRYTLSEEENIKRDEIEARLKEFLERSE